MKRNKNIMIMVGLAIMIACAGLLSACGNPTPVSAANDVTTSHTEKEQWLVRIRACDDFEEWCDTETGIHYILYSDLIGNGFAGGIIVRYNEDGTPYNCKEKDVFDTIVKDGEN